MVGDGGKWHSAGHFVRPCLPRVPQTTLNVLMRRSPSIKRIPILPVPSHDEIARCARELWTESGQPRDHDQANWLEAERRLLAMRRKPAAIAASPIRARVSQRVQAFRQRHRGDL